MPEAERTAALILKTLKFRPRGMTITEIAATTRIHRQTVSRNLEILRAAGQVDVRSIGQAKLYSSAQRVPLSAFLCFTRNLILVLDSGLNIVQVNDQYLRLAHRTRDDLIGTSLYDADLPVVSTPDAVSLIVGAQKEQVVADLRYRLGEKDLFFQTQVIPTTFEDGEKGSTVVLEDITERKEYVRTMEFLAETGRDLMDMGDEDDLYGYVARKVYSLAPGFLVWVNILDDANQTLLIKSFSGNPLAHEATRQILGPDVFETPFPINKADTAELIHHRQLVAAPPLYRLLHMQLPEEACAELEEAAVVGAHQGMDNYLMGLVSKGRIVGDVGISFYGGAELPNRDLIEAFVRQAAIAIDRKIADDNLRQSLAREQERVRHLLFLSRTARDFTEMEDSTDIHRYIGDRLAEMIPESIIFVTSFDTGRGVAVLRTVAGDSGITDRLWTVLGTNPVGVPVRVDDLPRSAVDAFGKTLSAGASLHDAFFRRVPERSCEEAARELGLGAGYGMNLSCLDERHGTVLVTLTRPGELTNPEIVEALVNQASVAIARRRVVERLRRGDGG